MRVRPGFSKILAPVALAGSVLVGVNLAWNLHEVQPLSPAAPTADAGLKKEGAPSPSRPQDEAMLQTVTPATSSLPAHTAVAVGARSAHCAPAPATKTAEAPAASAPPPPLTELQKIDRLLAYVGSLEGAVFIRNGDEHTPAEAVEHMKLKRSKAGDRVKTAEDFIKYCASYSTLSGKPYLIRFPDGRTRTAEDVLREELARMGP